MRKKHAIPRPYTAIYAELNLHQFHWPLAEGLKYDRGALGLVIPPDGPIYCAFGHPGVDEHGRLVPNGALHKVDPGNIEEIRDAIADDIGELADEIAYRYLTDLGPPDDIAWHLRSAIWTQIACVLPGIITQIADSERTQTEWALPRQLFNNVVTVRQRDEHPALERAIAFLRQELANGERPALEMIKKAEQAGISEATLNRARKLLHIEARREGHKGAGRGAGRWLWSIHPHN